ncbi:MAG: prepilin peptidase [Alphaproteobacteria bacterium]
MIIPFFLLFCMLAVLWFDVTRYMIPNWLCAALLLLYPVALYMSGMQADWQGALIAFGITFAVGFVIFARKWMGGGDVKLIIACSLWVGLQHLIEFVVLFAVIGGVLSIALYALRKLLLRIKLAKQLPRLLRDGEPVPYGIAIASAFLIMMHTGKIPVMASAGLGL